MTVESEAPAPRRAYLVRCWLVETEQGPVWRASVEDPHSGERYTFADLSGAFAFLGESTAASLQRHTERRAEERSE
jgi:hypothetical protein